MTRVRVIGIGSPFGDDRIGWDAVEAMAADGLFARFPAGAVEACCCDSTCGRLLALLSGIDAAILVDAMHSGAVPGALRRLDASRLVAQRGRVSSHGFGLANTLALGRALDLLPATVIVYGIEAQGSEMGAAPDAKLPDAMPALLRNIASDLRALLPHGAV